MRRRIVAGNWKQNGDRAFARGLMDALLTADLPRGVDVLVCPPMPYVATLVESYGGRGIGFGAQDVGAHASGAHTGEVAAEMLADIGAGHVLGGGHGLGGVREGRRRSSLRDARPPLHHDGGLRIGDVLDRPIEPALRRHRVGVEEADPWRANQRETAVASGARPAVAVGPDPLQLQPLRSLEVLVERAG